jgi:hypothetical protein
MYGHDRDTPAFRMKNFSSTVRFKNGKREMGGRSISETREVTRAVNAVPILGEVVRRRRIRVVVFHT